MSRSRQVFIPSTQKEALSIYTVDELKDIARQLQFGNSVPGKKAEIIEYLTLRSASPAYLKALNEIERNVLAETVHCTGGILDIGKCMAKYLDTPYKKSPNSYYRNASLLDLYIIKGIIPSDVLERLTMDIPKPEDNTIECCDAPPVEIITAEKHYDGIKEITTMPQIRHTDTTAIQNFEIILRLIESGKIRVSATSKLPSAATVTLIATHLSGGDWYPSPCYEGIQAFSWPLIMQAAGFATISNTTLTITTKGKNVLTKKMSIHDAIKMAWNAWKSKALIDEFSRIDIIKGQKSKGRVMTSPSIRRDAVNKALSKCPTGKWVTIDELSRFMQAEGLYFDVASDLWKLYICESKYGSLGYAGYGNWEIIQERYIKVLLMEYAATLGVVDIGYARPEDVARNFYGNWGTDDLDYLSRYDGLLLFRVNELGAYTFNNVDTYSPEVIEKIKFLDLLPNFDIVVTDKTKLNNTDLLFLNSIAEPISEFQWKITPRSLQCALENGEEPDHIRDYLSTRSKNGLPQTVDFLLGDAKSRALDFSFKGRACLLECNNSSIIQLINHDPKLKNLALVSEPFHIILKIGNEKEFFKRLNELGYSVPVAAKII